MEEILKFLTENPTFFIATCEENQPRVRPFGAVCEFDGKLYICTNNKKKVYHQIMENPKVEICGLNNRGEWLRVEAKAFRDDRNEVREAMLIANPGLRGLYKADDGIFEVLYLEDATATFYSFTGVPRSIEF